MREKFSTSRQIYVLGARSREKNETTGRRRKKILRQKSGTEDQAKDKKSRKNKSGRENMGTNESSEKTAVEQCESYGEKSDELRKENAEQNKSKNETNRERKTRSSEQGPGRVGQTDRGTDGRPAGRPKKEEEEHARTCERDSRSEKKLKGYRGRVERKAVSRRREPKRDGPSWKSPAR